MPAAGTLRTDPPHSRLHNLKKLVVTSEEHASVVHDANR